MNRSVELLAPAGSMKAFKAAINAGADAIYVGGNRFNAREYADNFSDEELLSAIDAAHLRGVKVYLTLNTLLKGKELKEIPGFIAPFYEGGIDAVLVQDLGVLSLLRERFPDLPLHSSTQMSISNVYGALLMKNLGVSRVVTSRELSLREIARIRKEADIEVETFIHGAMCYSYSGHCLMSSMLGGRSGNRGRCAGTCRLPFNGDKYPLSLKDLCTIDILPEIVLAGVCSLKIEGRMKSPEYVAGVVSIYRKYLDKLEGLMAELDIDPSDHDDKSADVLKVRYNVKDEDMGALFDLGNRTGFTKGFYHVHNDKDMVTFDSPSHTTAGEDVLKKRYGHISDAQIKKIPVNGYFTLCKDKEISLKLDCALNGRDYEFTAFSDKPSEALNKPIERATVNEKLLAAGESDFVFEDLTIDMESGLFVPLGALKKIRRDALSGLSDEILKSHKRRSIGDASGDMSGSVAGEDKLLLEDKKDGASDTFDISVSVTRKEQFEEVLKHDGISRIYVDTAMYALGGSLSDKTDVIGKIISDIKEAHDSDKEYSVKLPVIFREITSGYFEELIKVFEDNKVGGYLCGSFDGLGFLLKNVPADKIVSDAGLYTYSDKAKKAYADLGIKYDTVPYELNKKELRHRYDSLSEMIIYGRIPLMQSASCVHKNLKGCDKTKVVEYLKDRKGKVFPVLNNCNDCLNTIYNADILDLSDEIDVIKDLGIRKVRINLTSENARETGNIIDMITGKIKDGRCRTGQDTSGRSYDVSYTKGHFNRGVE